MKYITYYPNQYTDQERSALEQARAKMSEPSENPFVLTESLLERKHMLSYAHTWDPYNPLYNNPEYASKTKWGRLPALPCCAFLESFAAFPMLDDQAAVFGDLFYYGNDGGDIELNGYLFEGDHVTYETVKQEIIDNTPAEGGHVRHFLLHGEAVMKDDSGTIIGRATSRGRNAWKRLADGGAVPDDYAQTFEWTDYCPAVHKTTEEEWDYLRTLWEKETIRGAAPLYWEEVSVGDEPVPTANPPMTDIEMFRLHGDMIQSLPGIRDMFLAGEDLITDCNGEKVHFLARHYSYCRNPKARAIYYNFTARNFILRTITNWMGDEGEIVALKWRFMNLYQPLADNRPGEDILSRVPYMKGKYANRHGMEGDSAICKAYVVDQQDGDGHGLVTLACWAETLDGDIIQVMEITVRLPRRP